MALAKWSDLSVESTLATTALNGITNNTVLNVGDITNSTNKDLYAFLFLELGSITPATGGTITIGLRAKRGANYASNDDDVKVLALASGGTAKYLNFSFRIPNAGVWGVFLTNGSGTTLAASGNALYLRTGNEDIV